MANQVYSSQQRTMILDTDTAPEIVEMIRAVVVRFQKPGVWGCRGPNALGNALETRLSANVRRKRKTAAR